MDQKPTIFKSKKETPFHLSVGAVLFDEQHNIACHHFQKQGGAKDLFTKHKINGVDDLYILMRETLEPGESIEAAVHRGLQEEFGATGEIVTFIGSIKSQWPNVYGNFTGYKTTIYFLVQAIDADESQRLADDPESVSKVEWLPIDELIERIDEQAPAFTDRSDFDEREVLEHAKTYFQSIS